MRFDLAVIADWIEPKATVLDLGCGPGELLAHLRAVKEVVGTGIEKDEDEVATAIGRGLTVIQGDMNEEIRDYPDKSFDYVILSQTLMQVFDPARIIGEMIRVGRYGIVSFPNFGHWRCRAQLFFRGRAPVTRELPYQWYDTPNIRVIAYADFYALLPDLRLQGAERGRGARARRRRLGCARDPAQEPPGHPRRLHARPLIPRAAVEEPTKGCDRAPERGLVASSPPPTRLLLPRGRHDLPQPIRDSRPSSTGQPAGNFEAAGPLTAGSKVPAERRGVRGALGPPAAGGLPFPRGLRLRFRTRRACGRWSGG